VFQGGGVLVGFVKNYKNAWGICLLHFTSKRENARFPRRALITFRAHDVTQKVLVDLDRQ
jgi:FPC/CPF motif-containing protein YcgG